MLGWIPRTRGTLPAWLDFVAAHYPSRFEMLRSRRDVIGNNLKPCFGLTDPRNAVYPEVIGTKLEAYGRSVFCYFFEAKHISIN